MPLTFVDWEDRPAVLAGRSAWFVKRGTSAWAPASYAEVTDSGVDVSPERFKALFPDAPPLPSSVSAKAGLSAAA